MKISIHVADMPFDIDSDDLLKQRIGRINGAPIIHLYFRNEKGYNKAKDTLSNKFVNYNYDISYDKGLLLIKITI